MAKQDSPQQWVADFKAYLEFIRDEEKIKAVNLRAETVTTLRRRPVAPPTSAGSRAVPFRPVASSAPAPAAPALRRAPEPESSPRPSRPVVVAPSESGGDPAELLGRIAAQIAGCKACGLHSTRTNTVPGQGNLRPELMFVGEAPGADEDEQGLAFVGKAGQLLTKMILAMGFTREEVFIGNINKCRPPNNRPPQPEEMDTCLPYLKAQIAVLKPKVIVALGATAVRGLLKSEIPISKLRGTWQEFEGIPVMPTFHPAYLLRDPSKKVPTWDDLQAVLKKLDRPIPKRKAAENNPPK
jgi:uracil-DNA glycosylase family 4